MTGATAGKRKGLPYREGDWFAVPLRDGDWAVGIVARKRPRARIVLGYFFGPRRQTLPDPAELAHLTASDAIDVMIFAAHGMVRGEWPVLGPHPAWDRARWPMPAFCSRLPLVNVCVRREYPDDDPGALFVRQSRITAEECARLPRDGTSFVGAVEVRLTSLLAKDEPRPYQEGDWFALPLHGGGWATGIIARVPPAGGALLGYFFGPRSSDPPTLADIEHLTPADAEHCCLFGDLGLRSVRDDQCPVIGQAANWDRTRWPVPPFARRDPHTGQWFLLTCDDVDPGIVVAERPVSSEQCEGVPLHVPNSLDAIADSLAWRWEKEARRRQQLAARRSSAASSAGR